MDKTLKYLSLFADNCGRKSAGVLISLIFLLLIVAPFLFKDAVLAQISSSGIAVSVPIKAESVQEGDVVCSGIEGYVLCNRSHDPSMFGVVVAHPAAAFESEGDEDVKLVISSGNAKVRVTNANGKVEEGKLITSSETSGIAHLADHNAYVLGTALESFESDKSDDVGTILVSINIHPTTLITSGAGVNLLEALKMGFAAPTLAPLASLRYILAFIIVIIAFTIGFIYFGRVVSAGIEATGRNPLARRTIQISVFFNSLIMIAIILGGLVIAYMILIL